jgi:hypothetical protein
VKEMVKGKKSKLQSMADEIAKLERSVKRRSNQLEKAGKKTERPKHAKPTNVKEAKKMIFEMESYLRHTSSNPSVVKGAKRGSQIKKNHQIEDDYRSAKRLRKMASEAFKREFKNPINEERKAKGLRGISFEDFSDQFNIGSSPNKVKNKMVKSEWADMYKQDALFLKNHPQNSGEEFVESKISDYKRFALEQLSKSASDDEYADAMDLLLKMDNKSFLLWYTENENTLEELKHKYTEVNSHWDAIQSLTDGLFESLGVGGDNEEE